MNYQYQPMQMNFPFGGPGKFSLAPALYVGDLDEFVTEELLYDFFSRYGPIHFVRIMRDNSTGRSRGYAFVNFVNARDAELAKQNAQYEKLGRKHIRIMFKRSVKELPPEANVYVKNLDSSVNVKDLYLHFSNIGPILCCKVATDKEGNSLGYGYVQFEKQEDAILALEKLEGSKLKEKEIQLTRFVPKDKRTTESSRRNIYIKNLPVNKGEQEVDKLITNLFEKYGEIEMKLIKKHPTENKYSAFICYKDENVAKKAYEEMSKNPPLLDGAEERLYVNWYQGKNERQRDLKGRYAQTSNETNLYIKNLKNDVTEGDMKKAFQTFGKVTSVAVREWKDPKSNVTSKYGFVAFENRDDARDAQNKGLQDQEVRNLFQQGASPYINLHQSKERRNEYLSSMRRRKLQTGFMDYMQPSFMPMNPYRRFQPPYPMFNNQMPRMGGGPKNMGGNKPMYKDRSNYNSGPQRNTFNNNKNYQQNTQKPQKKVETQERTPVQTSKTDEKSNTQTAPITVQSLRNKLNEFLVLDEEKQRQILGELLFPLVKKSAGELYAPKITGMLIDLSVLEVTEILEFLEDPALLKERVDEAKELIISQGGQTAL